MEELFASYYKNNTWGGRQSRSGSGSDLEETLKIRKQLPALYKQLGIESVLDIPCGDFNWYSKIVFPKHEYIGADLISEIVEDNKKKYPMVDFRVLNVISDKLPEVDMILTRDCLGHLSTANVEKAVENIKRAKPKYFVATHWPSVRKNMDIRDGSWRPINMTPFLGADFKMVELIQEDKKDKYLGVWAYEPRG